MIPWMWALLISVGLLLLYVLFFYLSSLLRHGSPFAIRIRLSYYMKSAWEEICSIGPKLKAMIPKPKSARPLGYREIPLKANSDRPVVLRDLLPKSEPLRPASDRKKDHKKNVPAPDTRPGFAGPTTEPFLLAAAKQAAKERRRVWVKYRDEGGRETEDQIEIYRAAQGGTLWVWCCLKHTRRTLRRSDIAAWCILDERFERTPHLEQWAQGGWMKMPSWVNKLLQKRA